jgi:catechol 2,3-dioxygenase-like lactoylglutathione lyase family enzyme
VRRARREERPKTDPLVTMLRMGCALSARKGARIGRRAAHGLFAIALVAEAFSLRVGEAKEAERPRIYGIQEISLLSSDVPDAVGFYKKIIKLDAPCLWCEEAPTGTIRLPSGQMIRVLAMPQPASRNLLLSMGFAVDNLESLKKYLSAKHVEFKETKGAAKEGGETVSVVDPEGHSILFVKWQKNLGVKDHTNRIIHAGFVVKDRAAMDRLYKDVLGFHVYWHGGMKDGETDWVDMQVPDGTDWIEYMLNIPENADKQTLGVMNHFALGVPNVKAAAAALEKSGVKLPEGPQIGRDGKWQLNLYDADETRVELMEFTPVEKPCCSEYTGAQPKP